MIDIEIWAGKKRKETHGGNGGGAVEPCADEAIHAERADKAGYAESAKASETAQNAERAERAKTADEAIHAKISDEVSLESKTLARFIRKDVIDTAEQVITFLKGIVAKAVSYFQGIVNRGDINNNGDITNTGNISNAGDITNTGNIMTKNLTVTGKATFFELEMLKAKAAGGIIIQSAATFKIDDAEETTEGYACYQRAEKDGVKLVQMCEVNDQMMCYGGFNVGVGTNHNVSNHFYWRLVTDAPTQAVRRNINGEEVECLKIVLSRTDCADNSDVPLAGDQTAQVGNRTNTDRQSVIVNSAYKSIDVGLVAPYWAKYVGVNSYDLSKHRETYLAQNDNQIVGNLRARSSSGEIRPVPVLLGEWKSGKEYGYYDSVTHDGRQWLCVAVRGTKTTEEPGKGDAWMLLVDKGKDGKDGHSLTAKAFIEGSYRNRRTKGVKSYVKVFYDGQEVKDFTVSYRYKGAGQADWVKPQTNKEDYWVDAQRDGSTLFVEYVVEYKGLISVATGRLDNIQDGEDAVGYALVPLEEKVVAYLTDDKGKLVDVELMYKVRKSVGERVSFVTDLAAEGMTLEVSGGLGDFGADGERFFILESVLYEDNYDSYAVTLTKGGNVVDRRVLPITFKPKVVFDIDTKNGTITSQIEAANGRINSVEQNINETKSTVGNLSKEFTQMKQTSKEISMTVNNGTRPNLLWGSDLDLSGVQDVMKRAYELGNSIKKKTEEKAEWKRSRDNAGSDDDRIRYQEGMDDCDREIAQAQGEVAKCKAAIAKHLGVGLNATKVDNTEWFEYLKGKGVAGADAMKAKVAVVNGEGNYYAGLYWQIGFGAKSNVKVKPNTQYTFSFWVKTEILQGSGYAVAESINMESLTGGRKDRTMPWTKVPAKNEWERMSYTFTTGATGYIMVGVGLSGEKDFSGLIYLCHPKLEEGDTATPWCAYDGTVDALLAGGFDIKNRKFTATADNFKVQNNKGEQTFFVDENGRINNGMLVSKLRLTEPTIITKENYKEFCYNGKLNGHNVLFLDLLKCGTLLVLTDVPEELFLDLPSFKSFKSYNNYTQKEVAKEQYDKMRYIGNTIILYLSLIHI